MPCSERQSNGLASGHKSGALNAARDTGQGQQQQQQQLQIQVAEIEILRQQVIDQQSSLCMSG
jgi:hypothetical protein